MRLDKSVMRHQERMLLGKADWYIVRSASRLGRVIISRHGEMVVGDEILRGPYETKTQAKNEAWDLLPSQTREG